MRTEILRGMMWQLVVCAAMIAFLGCEDSRTKFPFSSEGCHTQALIDDLSVSLSHGIVPIELNNQIGVAIAGLTNHAERVALVEQYERAVEHFSVSNMRPDYTMLCNAWKIRDFFHSAHETVYAASTNKLDTFYFVLRMIANLESEATSIDKRLKHMKRQPVSIRTGTGPDLSEYGCLFSCARGLHDDARSMAVQYLDMPRHLFDEYTSGCTAKEKKKIMEDIKKVIGREANLF